MVIPSIVSNRKSDDLRTYKPKDPVLDKNLIGSRSTPTALHRGIYRKEPPWKPWDVHKLPQMELEATISNVFFQAGLCGGTMLGSHSQPSVHTLMFTQVVYLSVYPGLFHTEAKTEFGYLPLCPQLFCCSNCSCQIQWVLSPLSIELYKSCFDFQRFHSCLCLCVKQHKEQEEPAYEKTSKKEFCGSWNPIHGE